MSKNLACSCVGARRSVRAVVLALGPFGGAVGPLKGRCFVRHGFFMSAVGTLALLGVSAMAQCPTPGIVKVFTPLNGVDGAWDLPGNWRTVSGQGTTVPCESDRVRIPAGTTCYVDVLWAQADTVEILTDPFAPGRLWVGHSSDGVLELDNDTCVICSNQPLADNSIIDGELILGNPIDSGGSGANNKNGYLDVTTVAHLFEGIGRVRGRVGRIRINPGIRFINDCSVEASNSLVVECRPPCGDHAYVPIFQNLSTVKAHYWDKDTQGGLLVFETGVQLWDSGDAVWQATETEGGTIRFRYPATLRGNLVLGRTICDGDFNCINAFEFQGSVRTCGTFKFGRMADLLVTSSSNVFQYQNFESLTGCPNPASPIKVTGCTTGRWSVSQNPAPGSNGHYICQWDCSPLSCVP